MTVVAGYHVPFMASVTATTTPQAVGTLLTAIYPSIPLRAMYVQLQLDTTAGGTSLYIGNANVTATNCGVNLSANQANQQYAFDRNLIVLNDLWILASTGTAQVNLIVVVG